MQLSYDNIRLKYVSDCHYLFTMSDQRYKTELFIPIEKDQRSFEEREKNIWEDMHVRLERRRSDWEKEVERMRQDFFRLKPTETRRGSSDNLLDMDLDTMFDDDKTGNKRFRVGFDVHEFRPEEINVRTQEQKLIVHAKHEEKADGKSMSREFSRQVDIPAHVNPSQLACVLTKDGVLEIEAPVAAPAYDAIRTAAIDRYQSGPVVTERDGSRKLRMLVEVGNDFKPEDITVKTIDKKLVVHARHEEKSAGRTMFREFNKEFDLPEIVDPLTVNAFLSDDGKLTVEAPLKTVSARPTAKPGVRITVGRR